MEHRLIACILVASAGLAGTGQTLPQLGTDPVDMVIAAMTIKEKAHFVTGTGTLFSGSRKMVPGAAGVIRAIPRLGIPAQVLADGPAGLRISPRRMGQKGTFFCTALPVATSLASTWDTGLVQKVGEAMGNEALEYGADVILGPGMNIHRNPLCGRNFEYYSEDPLVTGKMAAAMVNGIQSRGVGASIKHFAANNAETNRNALNTLVSARALREIYLEGFRIAVEESQPRTVMSSYNLINGTYAPESHELLTGILREEWGFRGYVMSDWYGGSDAAAMMQAGNDLLMPGTARQSQLIVSAVKKGKLDVGVLDRNIARILNIMEESPRFKGYPNSGRPDLELHAKVAREAAGEGMVLLKNENRALPILPGTRIAAFGKASLEINTGGTGSGDVNEAYTVPIIRGLQDAGFVLNEELLKLYAGYLKAGSDERLRRQRLKPRASVPEPVLSKALIGRIVTEADIALITIGRNSGEFRDRSVEGDFNLTKAERELIEMVTETCRAAGKKSVVILNTGGVMETASWKEMPDAILLAWQGGQESGHAIADVISGTVNPSGKLATTFPLKYGDTPSARNFPGTPVRGKPGKNRGGLLTFLLPRPSTIRYEEGIYVGYRHYATHNVPVSYPFGYGLSYTRFRYGEPVLSSGELPGRIKIKIDILNEGSAAGREVVQLYLSAPAGKLDKPVMELKAFAKTGLLQPGESQTLTFELSARSMASFDPEASGWIAEAGNYTIRLGASSQDIRQSAGFKLDH
jgi:beta-glucosidase